MGLFGGGNSSSSSQTQNFSTTTTQDRRAVADGNGQVISADNSTINMTDNGAVLGALGLSNNALTGMRNTAVDAMAINAGVSGNAVNVVGGVAGNALNNMAGIAGNAINNVTQASSHLNDVGLSMLQANTALASSLGGKAFDTGAQMLGLNTSLAASLTNGTTNLVTHLMDTAAGLYRDASSKDASVVGIAQDLAKTQVAAQNDNRYIIAAALAVVCIVGVMAFKGKA